MAAVNVITAGKIWQADPNVQPDQWTAPAGVAVAAGNLIALDSTTGRWAKSLATTAANGRDWFMAAKSVAAGETVTGYKNCAIDGFNLDSLAYRAPVFMSDTAGELADAAGTVSIIVGYVRAVHGAKRPAGGYPDKILVLVP